MNLSRRNEPFRYLFEPGIPCLIRPYEMNLQTIFHTKQAQAELLDLSPRGCKLDCALNFRATDNECKLVLNLQLASSLELRGTILWQEVRAHGFRYGIRFVDGVQQSITNELKQYTRRKNHSKTEPSS
ncbi:PilZ domain-containing protein [Cohnella lubricantis]|uniref:PilZ domain-containing protein n=1 Tax=Cohnella lubricantis TaxID=2163172 RepID=A0A841T9W2_9BACL|nr:PilZ domain-containing protein [Cohnella lubricantis]MBB6676815.1 PilZ domain-containing protein [Cohnella lubricantis]MBP2120268.1 hypothetical protein [Cohnella lubricantis]